MCKVLSTEDFGRINKSLGSLTIIVENTPDPITAWMYVMKHIPDTAMIAYFEDNQEMRYVADVQTTPN